MIALHLILGAGSHAVIAQVVEAKFGSGAVSDVASVHLFALFRFHLVLDAADGQAEKFVEIAHPFGVAAGEEIVGGNELAIFAGKSVEIKRESCDEGFTFSGAHFCNVVLRERTPADELLIEVDHVALQVVTADGDCLSYESSGGMLVCSVSS